MRLGAQQHIVEHAQIAHLHEVLVHHAHPMGHCVVGMAELSRLAKQHQGALAGTVFTDKGEDLTRGDRQ